MIYCFLDHFLSRHIRGGGGVTRAPENLKLAGNWSKVAAMCGCQNHKKIYILLVFPLFISFTVVLCIFFWLLDQFGWQYIFPVA